MGFQNSRTEHDEHVMIENTQSVYEPISTTEEQRLTKTRLDLHEFPTFL